MMIAIGSDHGGVELKDYLIGFLRSKDVDVRDCGTHGRANPSTIQILAAKSLCALSKERPSEES